MPWWEKKLWRWYNATDHASNLVGLPTVAYSGENDPQKQAATVMARELAKVDVELTHVIGAKEGHKYTAAAKPEINRRVDFLAERTRTPPDFIDFTTHTLRYNTSGWLRIDGLERHWQPGHVKAARRHLYATGGATYPGLAIEATGVTAFTLHLAPGERPDPTLNKFLVNETDQVAAPAPMSDSSAVGHYRKVNGKWQRVASPAIEGLAKVHGLQGPIDDAFLDAFLHVRPTGAPLHEQTGKWVQAELAHAVKFWRSQYRGDAPITDDTAVTDAQIASSNLVLWGDPSSNKLLARVLDKLPLKWTADAIRLGDGEHDAKTCVPALIFPNPLNPAKYVVLNSGPTWREKHALNNADQVPKLPDYAIIDTSTPPDAVAPGKVVRAGFFGERWEPLPDDGR